MRGCESGKAPVQMVTMDPEVDMDYANQDLDLM